MDMIFNFIANNIVIVLTGLICSMWVAIYHKCLVDAYGIQEYSKNDSLNRAYILSFRGIDLSIGFWSMSHFLAYFIASNVSTLSKELLIFYIFYGVIWEFVEDLLGYLSKGKKFNVKHTRRDENNHIHYTDWWAGSAGDVIYNMLGVIIGSLCSFYKLKTFSLVFSLLYFICVFYTVYSVYKNTKPEKKDSVYLKLFIFNSIMMLVSYMYLFNDKYNV